MPLFYQHTINDQAQLAVWHITEDEIFFLTKVQLQKKINHPHKRLQHLAGRYLLQMIDPGFPVHSIEIADSNKPVLTDASFHFSISHCGNYAAAIVSATNTVGIDIEMITPKISSVKNKFLSEQELHLLPLVSNRWLTVLWSCKEAVFKWYGHGGIDFKEHIVITHVPVHDVAGTVGCRFMKNKETYLHINFQLFQNLCLAWVIL